MFYNRITLFILFLSFFQGAYLHSQISKDGLLRKRNLKNTLPEESELQKERKNDYPLSTFGLSPEKSLQYNNNLLNFSMGGKTKRINYSYVIPAGLIAYGTFETIFADKFRLGNYAVGHEVQTHVNRKFRIDDLTQYIPAVSVYALNLTGVKGKNNFTDRTIVLGIAGAFTAISVNGLKYTVKKERPDGSARNSFPSGHTTVAFMGAEFLWQEYREVSIWYGIAGYTIATGTGMLRMFNNKHWLGDVAAGAGLGILSTKLAYLIQPAVSKKLSNTRNNKTNIAIAPSYNGQQAEVLFSVRL